ncbi:MAG: Ala-tRNA(Pro) hydrolase [SAR116 cluster bacterium]|nr:Ala-tRNA(Pro) hydrolase [SAR116 cluster bacterium]RPH11237.1 MAG: alanyl-tRNA editing protein [Alphaproteobacteria bacterium TMED54]
MTIELFRNDSYLKNCNSKIIKIENNGIKLDQTIFYPEAGGQPGDNGIIQIGNEEISILDTTYVNNEIVHVVENTSNLKVDDQIECNINWGRRFNIMQVHTTLHLLCSLISAPVTGGQINENKGRLDFDLESKPNKEEILEALNNLIKQNHEISISSISEEELDNKPDLIRTMSVKPPRGSGLIRMINIGDGIDYQPCGGTHVKNTQEIREVKKIRVENKGRMNKRVIVDFL